MDPYPMRPVIRDDLGAIVRLIADADQVDYGSVTYTAADVAGDWKRPRFDLARDAWIFEAADGTPAGHAYVWVRSAETGEILLLGVVHPDHRGRGIGERLAASMEARAAEHLAGSVARDPVLTTVIPASDEAASALFGARGYTEARRFWRMEIDLASGIEAPSDPPGILIEQVEPERTVHTIHGVIQDAFTDHWRYVYEPFTDWSGRHLGRGDVPVWLLAYEGDEPAGTMVGWVEGGAGRVDQIAVRKPWRRRGVAAALLRRAFATFAAAGAGSADLEVDSENRTGATALYERVGMHPTMTHVFMQRKPG